MKLPLSPSRAFSGVGGRTQRAFTLPEILVASLIASMIMAALAGFLFYASRSISGVVTQTNMDQDSWQVAQLLFDRIRLATSVSNDASGNCLTLGFDDNPTTDTDKDGKAYNDKDRYEQFLFDNGDGNDLTFTNNTLSYLQNTASPQNRRVLLRGGVRKLPNQNIFTVTNVNTVLIRYALEDAFTTDLRQSLDLQLAVVPRNRPITTNTIEILP